MDHSMMTGGVGGVRVATLIAAVGALYGWGSVAVAQSDSNGKATTVEVSKVRVEEMRRDLRLPASLMPDEAVDLLAKTSGYVVEVNVESTMV